MYQTPKNSTQDFFTFKHADLSQVEAGPPAYEDEQLGTSRQEIDQLVESRHPIGGHDFVDSPEKVPRVPGAQLPAGGPKAMHARKSAVMMKFEPARRRPDLLGQILSTGSFKDRRVTAYTSKGTNKKMRPASIANEKDSASSFYQKSKSLHGQKPMTQFPAEKEV